MSTSSNPNDYSSGGINNGSTGSTTGSSSGSGSTSTASAHHGLTAGAKAGIAVGVIVGVVAIVFLTAMFLMRRRRQGNLSKGTSLQNLRGYQGKDEEHGASRLEAPKRHEPEVSSVNSKNPFSD
jgi:hypothetical protein